MTDNLYTIEIPTTKVREMIADSMAKIQVSRNEAKKEALKYKAEFIAAKRKKWFRNRALDKLSDEEFWDTFDVPDYHFDHGTKSPCKLYSIWMDKARTRHNDEADAFTKLLKEIDTYQPGTIRMSNVMLEMLNDTFYFAPRPPRQPSH